MKSPDITSTLIAALIGAVVLFLVLRTRTSALIGAGIGAAVQTWFEYSEVQVPKVTYNRTI